MSLFWLVIPQNMHRMLVLDGDVDIKDKIKKERKSSVYFFVVNSICAGK